MSRQLKRVPLDFDWPMNKTWEGYLNPHRTPCPEHNRSCFGGMTGGAQWFEAFVRLLVLAGEESRGVASVEDSDRIQAAYKAHGRLFPHPYLARFEMAPSFTLGKNALGVPVQPREVPVYWLTPITQDFGALLEAVAGEKFDPHRMDHGNVALGLRDRLFALAGLPEDWGRCPVCKGHAVDPASLAAYEAWTPEEPPRGDGFQLWENTSEGSPISPVYETLDEMCEDIADHCTTFGHQKATAEEWKQMLTAGFVRHREGNHIFM